MTTEDRFWKKVEKTSECWNWTASLCPGGYGKFFFNGRLDLAHRSSWIMARGPIPTGLMVLHKCDNRRCVNPDHLFIGDGYDNMRDASEKGRTCQGEKNWSAKLSKETVGLIRAAFSDGESRSDLAIRFGVSTTVVASIIRCTRWKHLGLAPLPSEPRYTHGEDCHSAKLTTEKAEAVRKHRKDGMIYREIGEKYGISMQAARAVCIGRTWKHTS